MRNLKHLLALLISLSFLCACSLTVPDVPICTELHPSAGYCVNTVSSKEFRVDDDHLWKGKSWWEIRHQMIYVPAESWAELKYFIIKVCKKTKQCDSDISGWDRTIDKIDEKIINKKSN